MRLEQPMQPASILWSVGVIVTGLFGGVAAVVLSLVLFALQVPYPLAPSGKELLLQYAPGPRLIVDSGSNAVHGFDPTYLGKETNRVGFLASDSGDVSPVGKAWRLLATARKGDLVLLPLEWLHYDRPGKLSLPYLTVATTALPLYFHASPWREKLRMLVNMPPTEVVQIVQTNLLAARVSRDHAYNEIESFNGLLEHGWNGLSPESPKQLLPEAAATDCENYLFQPGQIARGPDVQGLEKVFAPLRTLQAKGVTIVFIPPVVTGKGCYANVDIDGYWGALQNLFLQNGFLSFGKPGDLWFGPEYTTNTYYHVDHAGRDIASRRVAGWLRDAGLTAPSHPPHLLADATLELQRILHASDPPSPLLRNGATVSGSDQAVATINNDWWSRDSGALWTHGADAVFRLRTKGARSLTLHLCTLAIPVNLQVLIGDKIVATTDITKNGQMVEIPLDPHATSTDVALHVTNVTKFPSPHELGMSDDNRSIGLGLISVGVR